MNIAKNFQIKLSRNIDSLLRLYPWFKKGYPLCSIRENGEIHIPAEIRPTLVLPERIIFRSGALEKIGREIKSSSMFTKKGLLVTGKSAMKKLGVTQKIIEKLKEEKIEIVLFDQVESDPDVTTVAKGTKVAQENNCSFVIGLGGGSVLDTAKMIAFLTNKEDSAVEYLKGKEIVKPGIPFIAITTTGSGSEVTNNLMLRSRELGIKRTIRNPILVSHLAIVDPTLTLTLSKEFTLANGVDSLVAPLEALVCKKATPITDEFALASVRSIINNIRKVTYSGEDQKAREGMALGSLLGAISFSNSALGAVHGLANPFGTHFNLTHGLVCGVLLPYVMEYNLPVVHQKYARLAEIFAVRSKYRSTLDISKDIIAEIKILLRELNIPLKLKDLIPDRHITDEDINVVLNNISGTSILNNPRDTSNREVQKEILLRALG